LDEEEHCGARGDEAASAGVVPGEAPREPCDGGDEEGLEDDAEAAARREREVADVVGEEDGEMPAAHAGAAE
jgi:hypothetical protein